MNKLYKKGILNTIIHFQNVGHQILYGTYIDAKFRELNTVINFNELIDIYKKNISNLSEWNINYYRIQESECNYIIKFLDKNLNIVCEIETIPEGEGF